MYKFQGAFTTKRRKRLSLCLLSQALCHKDIWGSGGIAPPFLTSALDGGEWSASRSGRFITRERPPPLSGTHWIGGRVGPDSAILSVACLYTD
jgi:hypothetical protein